MNGADGYKVLSPDADQRRDYRSVYDASGNGAIPLAPLQLFDPASDLLLRHTIDKMHVADLRPL